MIITNLYQNVIEKEFKSNDSIDIISGYASGDFLKKVLSSCPGINIELYLGMSQEGISYSNHKIFREISRGYPNVNVYYQIRGNKNHMKIYCLSNKGVFNKSFVGSANFTDNGFGLNKEILIVSKYSFNVVFEDQKKNSLLCTDDNIEKYINIYTDDIDYNDEANKEECREDVFRAKENRLIAARNRAHYKYFKEFEIEIIKSNDRNWSSTGINSSLYNEESHILIGTKLFYENALPRDTELMMETHLGEELKFTVSSRYRDALFFVDIDIYEYLRDKAGLTTRKPISRSDLQKKNCNNIKFIRLDELRYYIEFY